MTPRSGSTLVQFLAFYYLKGRNKKTVNLKNYFNKHHYNMFFEPIKINGVYAGKRNCLNYVDGAYREEVVLTDHVEMQYNYNVNGSEPLRDINEETAYRLACLNKSNTEWTYCFKLHSFLELEPVYQTAIANNWCIICTEREPYEQLLEYAISMKTNIWAFFKCSREDIVAKLPKTQSITLKKEDIEIFLDRLLFYHTIKNRLHNKIVVKYKDILKVDNIFEVYNLLGFYDWGDFVIESEILPKLPQKIPFEPLGKYFLNINEIKDWYEEWQLKNRIP